MVREVCNEVLSEDKGKRKKRAEALKDLGELFGKAGKKAMKNQPKGEFIPGMNEKAK